MTTAADIIKGAYADLGKKATGQTLPEYLVTDGLSVLNDMIDSFSNDNFMIYEEKEESFDLVASQASYSIGDGADFDTVRPQEILKGTFIRDDGGSDDYSVKPIALDQYRSIPDKTQVGLPFWLSYNPTYPNGTIYLYYTPDASTRNLHLRSLKELTSFAATTTIVTLPPGYKLLLRSNLAIHLGPRNGKTPSPLLLKIAADSIEKIKARNSNKIEPVRLEVAGLSRNRRGYNTIAQGPY